MQVEMEQFKGLAYYGKDSAFGGQVNMGPGWRPVQWRYSGSSCGLVWRSGNGVPSGLRVDEDNTTKTGTRVLLTVMVEGDVVAEVHDTQEITHDHLRAEVEEALGAMLAKSREALPAAEEQKAAAVAEQAARRKATLDRL
jgi:hypothetical protein